jgi:hypothetical protein
MNQFARIAFYIYLLGWPFNFVALSIAFTHTAHPTPPDNADD